MAKRQRYQPVLYSSASDEDSEDPGPSFLTDRRFCPHCEEYVSLKTYQYHRRLYFDGVTKQWLSTSKEEEKCSAEESPPDSPVSITLEPNFVSTCSPPSSPMQLDVLLSEDTDDQTDSSDDAEEFWDDDGITFEEEIELSTVIGAQDETEPGILSKWLVLFMLTMQAIFKLSDVVINHFLAFFRTFFFVLGRNSSVSDSIAHNIPPSLYEAKKVVKEIDFKRYVVCKKCCKIYNFADCIEGARVKHSKVCDFCAFPSHPQRRMRAPCGQLLLKTVETSTGKKFFYPFLTYCYVGLEVTLQALLSRPNFLRLCEQWRHRKERHLSDVCDGQVWKEFLNYNGDAFLSERGNLALMLNVDFFQPFKHVQYSLGAMYLTVLNLPRDVRYKQENTILICLIPGPSEPKHDMNSFLEPFVDELLRFWMGVELNVAGKGIQKIRCALLCVACDLPAGRKVCGFLGHNARLGCSRCLKRFSGNVGNMDYSGFDRDQWQLRSGITHTQNSLQLLKVKTKSELQDKESEMGCRYSVLVKLPYFDAPRMLIVDPMHNLFLGSAKHFLHLLVDCEIVSDSQFNLIQERVDSFLVPSDMGRIPHKIRSGFASFTADQWKNWVIHFSLISLRDILPTDKLECWRHFVLACRILVRKTISHEELQLGDALLMRFCKRTELLFGKSSVTPNMHMHCHLSSCITDYGPSHGFWLYAFERYNGILGSMPNNNRSIETQLMARFLHQSKVLSSSLPNLFFNDFAPLFPVCKSTGSVTDTLSSSCLTNEPAEVLFPKHCSRHVLNSSQCKNLMDLYKKIYSSSAVDILSTYLKYASVTVNGKLLGSHGSRSSASSIVMAKWDKNLFERPNSSGFSESCRAARVEFICKHVATINGQVENNILVFLSWFKAHPKNTEFGKPITIWYHDLFEPDGIYSLVPIHFVLHRCVSLIDKVSVHGESVLFVSPCIDF